MTGPVLKKLNAKTPECPCVVRDAHPNCKSEPHKNTKDETEKNSVSKKVPREKVEVPKDSMDRKSIIEKTTVP